MKNCILILFVWAAYLARAETPSVPLWAQMQNAVVAHPDIAEVRRILDLGFDPNASIGCGEYPALLSAVERRDIEMTRLLLERGSKVPDQAMSTCCNTFDRDVTLVKLLVEHGGNVNAKSSTYYSCLHIAASRGNIELVQFLVKTRGIDLNVMCKDGQFDGTPLMWALRGGQIDVANLLVSAGAETKSKSEMGMTAALIISERLQAYEKLRLAVATGRP